MKKTLTSFILILIAAYSANSQTATVTTWKNEAKGAYSIIHDDYGSYVVDGIWQYADTIASNRGIKFTIGAISSDCETNRNINGYSNPYEYAKDVMIAKHNHEIISHSHTHTCAVGNLWNPCNMGVGKGWAESGDFANEIIGCTNSIEKGTGHKPQYYIFPYDKFTNLANDKLKELGYIGSRTGWTSALDEVFYRNGYNSNDLNSFYPDVDGFFRTSVQVFDDINTKAPNHDLILNSAVDNAIAKNEWANRELHNVGTSGWGSVSIDGYRKHIDYLQKKVKNGELWVGTISEILTYQIQKLKYEPKLNKTDTSTWDVEWTSVNPQYNIDVSKYLENLNYTSSLTLKVDFEGRSGDWEITQNGTPVVYTVKNKIFYVDVYPHKGAVKFELKNETFPAPIAENPIADMQLPMEFDDFSIDLNDVFEDANTSDEKLIYAFSGNTNISILINKGIATFSSKLDWEGKETIVFSAEDESSKFGYDTVIFTIKGRNQPYKGTPIVIPTKIESEDFDLGDSEVAFHEEDNNKNTTYRNEDVDIKNENGFVVLMDNKEWLEYTIQVDTTDYYDINVFANSNEPNTSITLSLNKKELRIFPLKFSTDSITFKSHKIYNVELKKGNYVLRVLAKGNFKIDYIEITKPGINSLPTITSNIPDQNLVIDFATYTLNLNNVFEDIETKSENFTYSTSGDTNVVISIEKGIATISSTSKWEGIETIIFSAKDFSNGIVHDTVKFTISQDFALPNRSVNNKQGYIFTFDQSSALNCPETMIGGFGVGYKIESVGGGNLVISSDGTQFGYHNVAVTLNDECKNSLIDLSHPDKRVLEIRIHSTVDVPQFLLALGDTSRTIADKDIQIHSLKANQWDTLSFKFNSLDTWGNKTMNPTLIDFVTLQFRKSWKGEAQDIAGTFTIDYIKIGGAINPCPKLEIIPKLASYPETLIGIDRGKDALLNVNVSGGSGNHEYKWFKNDTLIIDGNLYSGTNSSNLIVKTFAESDTGTYYCEVSDSLCGVSAKSQIKQLIVGDLNKPFTGTAINIPGKIEGENYDIGGPGISYFERNVPNKEHGNEYRNDDVDVMKANDGYVLTTTRHSEWLEYTVNVADSGLYTFEFFAYSGGNNEKKAILSIDGNPLTTVLITNTSSVIYTTSISDPVFLPAGEHVIRNTFYRSFWLDYITVKKEMVGNTDTIENSKLSVFPNPATSILHITSSDFDTEFQLLDSKGVEIAIYKNNTKSIDVSNFSSGIYILKQGNIKTKFIKK